MFWQVPNQPHRIRREAKLEMERRARRLVQRGTKKNAFSVNEKRMERGEGARRKGVNCGEATKQP